MPGCCATGCTNRTGHDGKSVGKALFSIPVGERNKERRAVWLQRINRSKYFEATKNTRLCEDHFTEDQFEQNRADGLRKLKPNAIPSIFSNQPQTTKGKSKKEQSSIDQSDAVTASAHQSASTPDTKGIPTEAVVQIDNAIYDVQCDHQALNDHAYVNSRGAEHIATGLVCTEVPLQPTREIVIVNANNHGEQRCSKAITEPESVDSGGAAQMLPSRSGSPEPPHEIVIARVSSHCEPMAPACANYHSYHRGAHYAEERIAALKRMLMNEGKRRRKAEEERDRLKKSLGRILGEDQLHMLEKGKMRGSSWSEATMKKAIRLRMVCGNRGYNFVKDQVVPLPSERTLQKHIVKLGLTPKVAPCTATILSHGGASDGQFSCDVFELEPG